MPFLVLDRLPPEVREPFLSELLDLTLEVLVFCPSLGKTLEFGTELDVCLVLDRSIRPTGVDEPLVEDADPRFRVVGDVDTATESRVHTCSTGLQLPPTTPGSSTFLCFLGLTAAQPLLAAEGSPMSG